MHTNHKINAINEIAQSKIRDRNPRSEKREDQSQSQIIVMISRASRKYWSSAGIRKCPPTNLPPNLVKQGVLQDGANTKKVLSYVATTCSSAGQDTHKATYLKDLVELTDSFRERWLWRYFGPKSYRIFKDNYYHLELHPEVKW